MPFVMPDLHIKDLHASVRESGFVRIRVGRLGCKSDLSPDEVVYLVKWLTSTAEQPQETHD